MIVAAIALIALAIIVAYVAGADGTQPAGHGTLAFLLLFAMPWVLASLGLWLIKIAVVGVPQ